MKTTVSLLLGSLLLLQSGIRTSAYVSIFADVSGADGRDEEGRTRGGDGGTIRVSLGQMVDVGGGSDVLTGEVTLENEERHVGAVDSSAVLHIIGDVVIRCREEFVPKEIHGEFREGMTPNLRVYVHEGVNPRAIDASAANPNPQPISVTMTPPPDFEGSLNGGTFEYFSSSRPERIGLSLWSNGGRGAAADQGGIGGNGGSITVLATTSGSVPATAWALGGHGGASIGSADESPMTGGAGGRGGSVNIQRAWTFVLADGGTGGTGSDGNERSGVGAAGGIGGHGGDVRVLEIPFISSLSANGGTGGIGGMGATGARGSAGEAGGVGGDGGNTGTIRGDSSLTTVAAGGEGGAGGRGGLGGDGYYDLEGSIQPAGTGGPGGDGGKAGDSSVAYPAVPSPAGGMGGNGGTGGRGIDGDLASSGATGSPGDSGSATYFWPPATARMKKDVIHGFCEQVGGSGGVVHRDLSSDAGNGFWGVSCDTSDGTFGVYFRHNPFTTTKHFIGACRFVDGRNRSDYVYDPFADEILSVMWINKEGDSHPCNWYEDPYRSRYKGAESDVYIYDAITRKLTIRTYTEKVRRVFMGYLINQCPVSYRPSYSDWAYRDDVQENVTPPTSACDLWNLFPEGKACTGVTGSTAPASTFASLRGMASPGTIGVEIRGINSSVPLLGGETAEAALALLANEINSTSALQEMGILASVVSNAEGSISELELLQVLDREATFFVSGQGGDDLTLLQESDLADYVRDRTLIVSPTSSGIRVQWRKALGAAVLEATSSLRAPIQWVELPPGTNYTEDADYYYYGSDAADHSQVFRLVQPRQH